MASLTDDNEADGNLDKRNIWLIGAGHTRPGGENGIVLPCLAEKMESFLWTDSKKDKTL